MDMEIKLNKFGCFILIVGLFSTVRMMANDIKDLRKNVSDLKEKMKDTDI